MSKEWLQIGESNSRLRVEKSRPKAFETMAELSSLYIGVLLGRNELLEKIIGYVVDSGGVLELDPKDHLVNYDNDNENDDLGYQSEEYFDEAHEEDENNHSNGNVVKRGITRLYKFRREYGKPDGIKLSVTFDALNRISGKHRALFSSFLGDMVREHIGLKILSWKKVGSEARDKLWDEITRYFDVDLTVRKLIENKEIKPDEEPPRGILWLKGRVNKDGEFPDDEIRSVGDKLKETEDKIKEGTLKVDHGTDAMTVVLGKKKEGYARGVGSGVTYKRYFDLPRSRQASDESIVLLQSQLDNERRERQEKELEIHNLSNKMSQTEGMVSPVDINPIDSSADEEGGTPVVGCEHSEETVNSVGSKKRTKSLLKESSRQDSQSQENVSPLLAIKCKLWHLKKSTIIALGIVYETGGKQMLHNKELPKDCYKVSIDKSLVDATCIPDVGNNGFKTIKDVVGGFFAWPKNQEVLDPKATPPSTIQMIDENKTAPKLQSKRKNVYVSYDAISQMQMQATKNEYITSPLN
ncbi:hypothetical protein Tco_1200202 [Tanacetum coccineum]